VRAEYERRAKEVDAELSGQYRADAGLRDDELRTFDVTCSKRNKGGDRVLAAG